MLHVGDRFTDSGNDVATRDICSVLWVANPEVGAAGARRAERGAQRGKGKGGAACQALLGGWVRAGRKRWACPRTAALRAQETGFFIKMLLKDIRKSRWQPYIE